MQEAQSTRYYFGKVDDGWKPALAKYERDWPHILEHGCHPPDDPDLTVQARAAHHAEVDF